MIRIAATRLGVGRFYRAPPGAVWDLITDTARWPLWGPTVRAVRCPQRRIRLGSEGRVQTAVGVWLPFVVTEFEPGRFWRWKVARVPATGHRVRPGKGGGCALWFEMPLAAAPYVLVCRMALGRIEKVLRDAPADRAPPG